jgi:hypothetical protein
MNMASPGDPGLMSYVDWLIDQRVSPRHWGGCRLNARCLEALAAYRQAQEDGSSFGVVVVGKGPTSQKVECSENSSGKSISGSFPIGKGIGLTLHKGQGRLYLSTQLADLAEGSGFETGVELVVRKGVAFSVGDVVKANVVVRVPRHLSHVCVRMPLPGGLRPFAAGRKLLKIGSYDRGFVEGGYLYLYAKKLKKGHIEVEVDLQAYIAGIYQLNPPEIYVDGALVAHGKKGSRAVSVMPRRLSHRR